MIEAPETLICRGMRDLLPDEMTRFRHVEQVFRDACRSWGYDEIRTPTIEHLYLFTSFGTLSPQLLGRVYSFLDWDGWTGERVVLRPDATIPVARLFRERLTDAAAKLAYVTNIFRFSAEDEPREIWQCGAELIGESWPFGDLEQIAIALYVVRALGISDVVLCLSHTGVVRSLLEHAGFTTDEQSDLYDRILDGDVNVVRDVEARLPELSPALRLLTGIRRADGAFVANLRSAFLPAVPGMAAPLDELELIAGTAASAGVRVEVSVTDVRDFEYYTGPVFRLSTGTTTVASGGRYDSLITADDGTSLPACGFALHVDPILPLIGLPDGGPPGLVQVKAAESSPEAHAAALDIAGQLHAAGFPAALVDLRRGSRWCLTVDTRPGRPRYLLEDRESGNRTETESTERVLDALRKV